MLAIFSPKQIAANSELSRSVPAWFGILLIVTLWLLARPYLGLRHDALLYLAQSLRRLNPEFLSADVFFAYGSQDSFSVFSRVLASLYEHLAIERTQFLVLLPASIASLMAVYRFLACLPSVSSRWLGVASFVVMSSGYGGGNIFSFGEDFVTARTIAEPLILWALTSFVHEHRLRAFALLSAALLFHPLMALPAVVILWIGLCQKNGRWAWLLSLTLPLTSLALAGVAPFNGLLRTYDDDWWRLVKEVNGQVLLQEWSWSDWQSVIVDGSVIVAAVFYLPRPLSHLYRACFYAAVLLLGVSAIGADVARDLLITQLQLWRVLWLVRALALCGLPYLMWLLWCQGRSGRMAAVACLAAFLMADVGWPAGWPLLIWACMSLWICAGRIPVSTATYRVAAGGSWLCIALLSGYIVHARANEWQSGLTGSSAFTPMWLQIAASPAVAMGFAALALWAVHKQGLISWMVSLATVFLLMGAATHWDRRSEWTRFAESSLNREHPFARWIPAEAQVLWQDNLVGSWVLLGRASYYAKAQGAGLLFNEGTAREFGPRWDAFERSRQEAKGCRFVLGIDGDRQAFEDCVAPRKSRVAEWCRRDPKLAFVVVPQRLSLEPVAHWGVPIQGRDDANFYLYSCGQFAQPLAGNS